MARALGLPFPLHVCVGARSVADFGMTSQEKRLARQAGPRKPSNLCALGESWALWRVAHSRIRGAVAAGAGSPDALSCPACQVPRLPGRTIRPSGLVLPVTADGSLLTEGFLDTGRVGSYHPAGVFDLDS